MKGVNFLEIKFEKAVLEAIQSVIFQNDITFIIITSVQH
jgi:hypothetical protein